MARPVGRDLRPRFRRGHARSPQRRRARAQPAKQGGVFGGCRLRRRALCALLHGQDPEPKAVVDVPFDPSLDLIIVAVRIVGPRGPALLRVALDTACAETLIVPEALDEIGYGARDGDTMTTVTTALGRESGYRLRVERFFALGNAVDNFTVHVHDLPEEFGLKGLLGLNFLRRFNYEIRSQEGRIRIEPV
ncbi:MAG: hypothetical protein EXR72_22170 [Myxococcales bacterium]|nr:hypothetical protein [Myxococcales bacterium]